MVNMTWEQKLEAMQALCGWPRVSLKMRKPGDWYVEVTCREISSGAVLKGKYGNGYDPASAVEDDWRQCVEELEPREYIVIHAAGKDRRAVLWNGYMWADVEEQLRTDFA